MDLKAGVRLFGRHQVPPLGFGRERIDRKNRIALIPRDVLLEREIGFVDRVVPCVQGRDRVVAAGKVPRDVDRGARERVDSQIRIGRKI